MSQWRRQIYGNAKYIVDVLSKLCDVFRVILVVPVYFQGTIAPEVREATRYSA